MQIAMTVNGRGVQHDVEPRTLLVSFLREACALTGYQGRTGIFELLLIDDEARRLIHDRASEADLREHARSSGMKGLREDGLRWVRAGETSLEEVLRVSRE